MFQLSGKLDHILPTTAYFDPEWYAREVEAVFRPNWQFFCLADELSKPGSRYAKEILGEPVVAVNVNGKLSALSNVCAHRHSRIVPDGASSSERLRCQIHGWEYDETGRLSHLPDGRSFRGIKAHDLCLRTYRVEQLGPLVFVNLSNAGPTVEEYLGTFAAEFIRFFGHHRKIDAWTTEHPVNWKVIVENAVESYHVPMVHPNTFQDYRAEELHDHRMEPTYTRYGDLLPYANEKSLDARGIRMYTKLLIKDPTFDRFVHTHVFPNFLLYFGDICSTFTILEPVGPERTRYTMLSFVPTRIHWGPFGRALQNVSMPLFVRMFKKILGEDMVRWPPVQAGLRSSTHAGALSAREERVYAAQAFVLNRMRVHDGQAELQPPSRRQEAVEACDRRVVNTQSQ